MRRISVSAIAVLCTVTLGPAGLPNAAAQTTAECQGQTPTFIGTDDRDYLTGTEGPDVIAGLGGDDIILGHGGADVICGGSGADTASYGEREVGVTADLDGQAGDDGSDEDGPAGARDSIGTDVENLEGGTGDDVLTGDSLTNEIDGFAGDDLLDGGPGRDYVWGWEGDDTVIGGDGDDVLSGFWGTDTVLGLGGDDYLTGVDADEFGVGDTLDGGAGNDALVGSTSAANEVFRGGPGNDLLFAKKGDDTLSGGAGDDDMYGHNGSDQLTGGPGTDTAVFGNYFGATVSIGRGVGDDGGPDDGPPGHRDTVGRSVENLRGGRGRDTLIGNGADNTLEGGGSSDTLLGRGGRDLLLATDGLKDERLDCGPGKDFRAVRDRRDPVATSCARAVR